MECTSQTDTKIAPIVTGLFPSPSLIIICGLPGSGKSTLTEELLKALSGTAILRIDPDIIERELQQPGSQSIDLGSNPSSTLKQPEINHLAAPDLPRSTETQEIVLPTEKSNIVDKVATKDLEKDPKSFDSAVWKAAREQAFLLAKQSLQSGVSVLVEDTFLLRGYRRRFRGLARDAQTFYAELELLVPLPILLARNQLRKGTDKHLLENTLQQLSVKQEPGDYPLKLIHSPSADLNSIASLLGELKQSLLQSKEYFEQLRDREKIIENSQHDGKTGTASEFVENAAQLELVIRKFVSQYLAKISKTSPLAGPSKDSASLNKDVAAWKKDTYEQLKQELFATSGSAKLAGNFVKTFIKKEDNNRVAVEDIIKYLEGAFHAKLAARKTS